MAAAKTGQDIINNFRLLIDEQDDLSDAEVLDLAQQVIDVIVNNRPWTFLTSTATGTLNTTAVSYSLPSDFRQLTDNYEDNGMPTRVLFVGPNFEPYKWIDMMQRRNKRDTRGFAYIDFKQSTFVLTHPEQIIRDYEFDYIYNPENITLDTSPVIPVQFQPAIVKFMAYLWADIDQTDRSFSYALENAREYQDYIAEMAVQDAQQANQYKI